MKTLLALLMMILAPEVLALATPCNLAYDPVSRQQIPQIYDVATRRCINETPARDASLEGCMKLNDQKTIACPDGVYVKSTIVNDIDRSIQEENSPNRVSGRRRQSSQSPQSGAQ